MAGTAEYLKRWRKNHPGYHKRWMAESRMKGKIPLEKHGKILGVSIRKDFKKFLEHLTARKERA